MLSKVIKLILSQLIHVVLTRNAWLAETIVLSGYRINHWCEEYQLQRHYLNNTGLLLIEPLKREIKCD